ncbi:MAG: flavin-containing monooxygenase [Rhodanobacteraceae bacterium]
MSVTAAEALSPAHVSAARTRVDQWLERFSGALARRDATAAAAMFAPESYWRDLVSFTWNIKTMEGREDIADMLRACLDHVKPSDFRATEEPTEADGVVEAWIGFETAVGRGKGHLRLTGEGAWTLLTTLYELKGLEENHGSTRPKGTSHTLAPGRRTWPEQMQQERNELGVTRDPYVVVIGGGQSGTVIGARLHQLGVPAIVLDKHDRPGGQWRNRYKKLALHDPVWYDHLPYIPFPDNWPIFSPKDKIADWLEMYVRVMDVNYWPKSTATSAQWDDATKTWTVKVDRDGKQVTLHPKQLVFATGMSAKPNQPKFRGMEAFKGDQCHSSDYRGPDGYAGKKAVVIGANNSAHDICGELWETGAQVTMVQRSPTCVIQSASLMDLALGDLYSERAVKSSMTTEKADLTFASLPYRIMAQFQIPVYAKIAGRDKDLYDRLEKAGFWVDWGEDKSGLFMKYLRRASGYYIGVGVSELIADGKIKVAHGQVDHLTEHAVVLDDGTELPADLVVYATGYGSMNGWVADLIDQETADKVGKCWGVGSDTAKDPGPWEGEERNMWKPTQQEALWFQGGNLHQSRHYSLYLALQLKARYENLPTPVYGLQAVHHVR